MNQPPYGAPPQYPGQQPNQGYGQQPGQSYPQQQAPAPLPTPSTAGARKGFFAGLFDLSFSSFITTKIIKVLYGLWIIFAGLAFIGLFIAGIIACTNDQILQGLAMMIVSPLIAILYLILGRIYLEIVIVLFRIAENVVELNAKTK